MKNRIRVALRDADLCAYYDLQSYFDQFAADINPYANDAFKAELQAMLKQLNTLCLRYDVSDQNQFERANDVLNVMCS
jgi:hypothetical protein